jgi:hypothetical protein
MSCYAYNDEFVKKPRQSAHTTTDLLLPNMTALLPLLD